MNDDVWKGMLMGALLMIAFYLIGAYFSLSGIIDINN